jgi:Flp pilus assembly protein TadG
MKTKDRSQNGQAVIEFALVLPILLLVLGGIIEFGILFYNKQVIANASREGVRAGIVNLKDKDTGIKKPIYIADIENVVREYCDNKLITFGVPALPSVTSGDPEALSYPSDLTVQVNYQYTFILSRLMNVFGVEIGPTIDLGAYSVMRME